MKHIILSSMRRLLLAMAFLSLATFVAAAELPKYKLVVTATPAMAGTFNTDSVKLTAGEEIQLHAFTNGKFSFKEWVDADGTVVSSEQNFTFAMPAKDMSLSAVFEYNPANPANPATNYWNPATGEVIIDYFSPGTLLNTIDEAIGDNGDSDMVTSITVAGRITDNDFGVVNHFSNCSLLDLSRVTGVTHVPSYAFDYTKLESVYLPATIEKIGYRAFYNCQHLSSLIVYAMMPPTLESNVFQGVPEGLVVYVPAAAIAQYQDADVWKNFTILPIQEDIRSISISLPDGTNAKDYAQMWLELTNTRSGQKMHYVMTDRQTYTFANIIRNTSWNVTLRNEHGDVFGQIDNVEVKDEDVTVTFASLSKPQNVSLAVLTPDGNDVASKVQVTWTDAQGNYVAQGASLSGLPVGYQVHYRMVLSQELAMQFDTPSAVAYTLKDGSNALTCQLQAIKTLTITGKVKDASTGLPLSGAVISASQTFGGKYSKTLNAKTDAGGVFTMEVFNVLTSVAVAATDYVSQTLDYSNDEFSGVTEFAVPDVSLKSITGATISVGFTYTTVEGETQNWYSDYQNVSYTLYNITREKPVSQFNVQYPQIVLLEEVEDGDMLRLTATSRTNAFKAIEATTTIAEQKAEATFAITELGRIEASFSKTSNASVVGALYDASGKLVKTYNYSEAKLTINDLADGNYTLVSMGSSRLFNTIYDLAQLPQTGLAEGTDYVQNTVEIKSGAISTISIEEVPTLDESKLYYTGDNTSFTVNKPSIVAGNYLTMTGRIDFKSAYATNVSNVQMIVDLPESCQFVENSVMVGNSTSSYTLNGNRITIPMTRYTDRVRFCIIPTLGGEYAPSAFAQFDLNGETVTQPIGSANYTAKDLSISVPSTVAKTTVPVSGTAFGSSNVEIYDNDVLIGQTTSLANGTWATTCELNEPYNLSRHQIYAKVTTKAGMQLQSETVDCMYDMNFIQVSKVHMLYNGNDLVFDFLNPETSNSGYYSFVPSRSEFTFTVDFTDNDTTKISDVIVYAKTSANKWVPLEAFYNDKKQCWVAYGTFNSSNLPVNVSVNYDIIEEPMVDTRQFVQHLKNMDALHDEIINGIKLAEEAEEDGGSEYELIDESDFLSTEELLEWNIDNDDNIEEINVDSIKKACLAIADLFNMKIGSSITMPDGTEVIVRTCENVKEEELVNNGFQRFITIDGKSIYSYSEEGRTVIVNFSENLYFEINGGTSIFLSRRAVNSLDSFQDWVDRLKNALISVQDAYEDMEKMIGNLVNNLDYDYEKYCDLVDKYGTTFKRYNTQVVNLEAKLANGDISPWDIDKTYEKLDKLKKTRDKWKRILKAAEKSKKITEKTLGVAKKLLPTLKKICPIIKYSDLAFKGIGIILDYKSIHKSVPDPCLEDQEKADKCRDKTLLCASGAFGLFSAKLIVDGILDISVAAQAASSVFTGGTTVLTAFSTAVGKMVLSIALDAVFDAYNNNQKKSLKKEIRELKCKKDNNNDNNGGGHPSNNPDKKFGIDPSGYVYEGVFSNRIEGAMATVFYKETVEDMYGDFHENIVKWNAEEYAQKNPLFTDENGFYHWDVPQGLWQVKFEKEGYETTYSEWLPVPPPQLDVNIAMKQNVQPTVKLARAYEDAVEVEFNKYMMPELLTTDNIRVMQGNEAVAGSIELLNNEASYEGSNETFASKIRFNAAEPFTEQEITLMVSNRVKSYAGIRMQDDYQQAFTIEQEIKQIAADSVVTVGYGNASTLTVSVLPASASKGKTLTVKTSSPMILSVETEQVTIGNDGKAEIAVNGELPGTAALTFSVEGTDKTAMTIANVEQIVIKTVATPKASIASGTVVEKGTAIMLTCKTEGATIYYTLDGSCPCDESSSRKVYDGTPIIINEDVTIKVFAVAPGMEDSDVAEFHYLVMTEDITELTLDGRVKVWPLPVRDRLNVTANGKTIRRVTIATLNGLVAVTADTTDKTVAVDVHSLQPGIYIATILTKDGTYSCKILKTE